MVDLVMQDCLVSGTSSKNNESNLKSVNISHNASLDHVIINKSTVKMRNLYTDWFLEISECGILGHIFEQGVPPATEKICLLGCDFLVNENLIPVSTKGSA